MSSNAITKLSIKILKKIKHRINKKSKDENKRIEEEKIYNSQEDWKKDSVLPRCECRIIIKRKYKKDIHKICNKIGTVKINLKDYENANGLLLFMKNKYGIYFNFLYDQIWANNQSIMWIYNLKTFHVISCEYHSKFVEEFEKIEEEKHKLEIERSNNIKTFKTIDVGWRETS